jgi:hypothetical protein
LRDRLSHVLHHEITIGIVGILTALVGHEAATGFVEWDEGRPVRFLAFSFGAFIALTLAFYWAYENPLPKKLERPLRVKVTLWGALPWLAGAAAFVLLFAFAAQVHRAIEGHGFELRPFVTYLLLFGAAAAAALYLVRNGLLVVHSRYLEQETMESRTAGAKHLVVLLSDVKERYRDSAWLPPEMEWSNSLDDDLKALVELKERGLPPWPWEMPLRALRPHRRTLESMTLVCSPKSIRQAPAFANRVKHYPEFEKLKVDVWCEHDDVRSLATPAAAVDRTGFSFNDVNTLSSALVDLLKYLRFKERIKPRDIMIDYTGGQKPASVVAAAVTLRGELRAQYVDTETLDPLEYDLVTNPEPKSVG